MSRDAHPDSVLHRRRRQRVLENLGDGLLMVPTAGVATRNADVHHEHRPGSDFHYLCGFPEPEAVLCAWRKGRGKHEAVLFVRPRDALREIWDGKRYGTAGARRTFGVDRALPIESLWQELPALLAPHGRLFFRLGADAAFDRKLFDVFARMAFERRRANVPAHPTITDPGPTVAAERLVKDAADLAAMRRAAEITCRGHLAAMRAANPGMFEYEVQSVLEAEFRAAGSPRNGYSSIVASGPNACVLHYHENDRKMRSGDLLLIDAGAEIDGSTGDVTRTFPVNGRFTEAQAAVYRVVLRANQRGIAAVRPGAAWDAPHKACLRELTKGLVELGVLRGKVPSLVSKAAFRPWYMHGTSHWLGRDVHDVGPYQDLGGAAARMPKGSVLTVEPGLYFDRRDSRVPSELRGIGIRIEDDVLVTAAGCEVLTDSVPKSISGIEAACRDVEASKGRSKRERRLG
jgi:Xaa-Pro aminopeptidase